MQYPYFGEVNINNERHFAWQHEVIYNNSPVKLMLDYRYIPSEPTFYLDKYRQCFEKIEFFDTQAKKSLQDYFVKNPKILQNKFGNLSLEDIIKFLKLTIVSIHAFEDDEDEEYLLLTYDFLAIRKPISLNVCLNCEGKVLGFKGLPNQGNTKPIKFTIWTGIIWALVVALFIFQYDVPMSQSTNDVVVGIMFLLAIYVALPLTILVIIDWISHQFLPKNSAILGLLFFFGVIYGILAWVNTMLSKKVAFFEIKIILLLLAIPFGWKFVYQISKFVVALSEIGFEKITHKKLPRVFGIVIFFAMCFLCYHLIRIGVEKTPLPTWFFNFGN